MLRLRSVQTIYKGGERRVSERFGNADNDINSNIIAVMTVTAAVTKIPIIIIINNKY